MLPFANTKICLILLSHTCKERKTHMTKVANQNSDTSKKFVKQSDNFTVVFYATFTHEQYFHIW
jgi:hypothetical protein